MTIYFRLVLFATLVFISCSEPTILGGEITVRNDILDKEYNSFVIDHIESKTGGASFRKVLRPQEQLVLPFKGISSVRFTRQYNDHAKVYVISCPEDFNKKITVKLIDVHTNRLPGGCNLVKRGIKSEGGYIKWE